MNKEIDKEEIPAVVEDFADIQNNCDGGDLPFGSSESYKVVAEFQIEGTKFTCSQYEDGTQTVYDTDKHGSFSFDASYGMTAMQLWAKGYNSGYKDGYDQGGYDNEWELHRTLGIHCLVSKPTLQNLFAVKPRSCTVKIIVAKRFQGSWDYQILTVGSEGDFEIRLQAMCEDGFRKVLADEPTEMFDASLWDCIKEFEELLELSDDTGLSLYVISNYPSIGYSKYFGVSEVFSFESPSTNEDIDPATNTFEPTSRKQRL